MCFCQPLGEHPGQPPRDSPLGSPCGIPQLSLPTANTRASALSRSPEMWCLLVLLCSQGAAFSAGFTAPFTLGSEGTQHMKHRNPEDFMNVVSCGTFSVFLFIKCLSQYCHHGTNSNSPCEEASRRVPSWSPIFPTCLFQSHCIRVRTAVRTSSGWARDRWDPCTSHQDRHSTGAVCWLPLLAQRPSNSPEPAEGHWRSRLLNFNPSSRTQL